MEPKFINEFQVTLQQYGEWSRHPVSKRAKRLRGIILLLEFLVICSGIFLFVNGLFLSHNLLWCAFGLLFFVIALFQLFWFPKIMLKKRYALLLAARKCTAWIRRFTFTDEIVCEDGNQTTRYAYSDIVKFKEDGQYFYLFIHKDMALILRKDSFIKGSADEFRSFFTTRMSVPPAGNSPEQ